MKLKDKLKVGGGLWFIKRNNGLLPKPEVNDVIELIEVKEVRGIFAKVK